MTLHELYEVLGDGCFSLERDVPNEGDGTIYIGTVADFPYRMMRDYGDRDVLKVKSCSIYEPGETTANPGISILINRNEEDD